MKNDKVYLINILESIDCIMDYTKNGREEFMKTKLIQDAVIRNLEIIGEATKKISSDLRQRNKDIPWRQMSGLRDVLIHDYMGVDLTIIWNVVETELHGIKTQIKSLLSDT